MTNALQKDDIIIFLEEAEDGLWEFGDMALVTSVSIDYVDNDQFDTLEYMLFDIRLMDGTVLGFEEDDEPFYTIYDPTKDIQGLTPVENAIAQAVLFFDKGDDIPQYAALALVDALKRLAGGG